MSTTTKSHVYTHRVGPVPIYTRHVIGDRSTTYWHRSTRATREVAEVFGADREGNPTYVWVEARDWAVADWPELVTSPA